MAPVEGRNVRTNTMFSAILAVLFAIKSSIKFKGFCLIKINLVQPVL